MSEAETKAVFLSYAACAESKAVRGLSLDPKSFEVRRTQAAWRKPRGPVP